MGTVVDVVGVRSVWASQLTGAGTTSESGLSQHGVVGSAAAGVAVIGMTKLLD